jgi:hypothetical protein
MNPKVVAVRAAVARAGVKAAAAIGRARRAIRRAGAGAMVLLEGSSIQGSSGRVAALRVIARWRQITDYGIVKEI